MAPDYVLIRVAGRGGRTIYHELATNGTDALCGRVVRPDDYALRVRSVVTALRWMHRCVHCAERAAGGGHRQTADTGASAVPSATVCPLDGIALAEHARCAVCGLLIGPCHYARDVVMHGNRILCTTCARCCSK